MTASTEDIGAFLKPKARLSLFASFIQFIQGTHPGGQDKGAFRLAKPFSEAWLCDTEPQVKTHSMSPTEMFVRSMRRSVNPCSAGVLVWILIVIFGGEQ